VGRCKL